MNVITMCICIQTRFLNVEFPDFPAPKHERNSWNNEIVDREIEKLSKTMFMNREEIKLLE